MEIMLMINKRHNPVRSNQSASRNNGGIYEVKVKGLLDDHWQQWFEGMTLKCQENVEAGQDCTLITGPIADQPALHGLLGKIRDLNLTLISVRKINPMDMNKRKRVRNGKHKNPRSHKQI